MPAEIVIVGFPKCGTSALMLQFEADSVVHVLRAPNGGIEITWPAIKRIAPERQETQILAHKFTSYIFMREALRYLTTTNPSSIMVLCIRDPKDALFSWHNMHRDIARSGRIPKHFAHKNREFYGNCSISEYYERFARRRLRYDAYFEQLISIVPKENVVVVAQERMAKGLGAVAEYIKALARGEAARMPEISVGTCVYDGYADKSDEELKESIWNELQLVKARLYRAIEESGVRSCL